jgi:hypothetical protein
MNPNGNPLVQEVGLDLDTCLKTGRAVKTFGPMPYRIYPINPRSRRAKRKTKMYFAACPQIIAAASGLRPD